MNARKKFVFIILIILTSIFTYHKVAAQDIDKAKQYNMIGQYEKAAIEFENCIPYFKEQYGENDTANYSKLLLYTARSFQMANDVVKAEYYYKRCIVVYNNVNATSSSIYGTICIMLARLYGSINDYQSALPLYIDSKQIYEKVFGKEDPDYATICDDLAQIYTLIGDNEKALPLFIESNQILKKAYGKEHPY